MKSTTAHFAALALSLAPTLALAAPSEGIEQPAKKPATKIADPALRGLRSGLPRGVSPMPHRFGTPLQATPAKAAPEGSVETATAPKPAAQ